MFKLLVFCSLIALGTADVTCAKPSGEGPCVNSGGMHYCPDGSGCIINPSDDDASFCCLFTDMVSGSATTVASQTVAPGGSCVDQLNPKTGVSDCPARISYCNNPAYYDLMTQQCPKTCNRCGGGGVTTKPNAPCVDLVNPRTGVSDCPAMKAYCQNVNYVELMYEQCKKTCGYC